jgi:glycine cleavage system H protein
MSNTKYSKDHEWILMNGDGSATVGITDFAQKQLGDIVYVELPEVGTQVNMDDDIAVVESVKAASDVKSPVGGKVLEINEALNDGPEKVNEDPGGKGWFLKLEPDNPAELDQLMDEEAYTAFISNL